MNTQYKKGVLELCVLSLLKKRDCYGYEISEFLAGHIDIADGTVYPMECGKRGYDLYPRRAQPGALRTRRRAPAHVGGRDRQLAVENVTEKMAECVRG